MNVRIIVTMPLISVIIWVSTILILLSPPIAAEAKVGIIDDHDYDRVYSGPRASIAVSGNNNIYLTWWDNKTGNNEVFFAGSNDGGKSFGKPINLSNDKGGSADSQIATLDNNNVYVTWWDNKTGSWQVFSRSSNDGGKTFNDAVILKAIGSYPTTRLKAPPSNTISVDTIVAAASGNNNNEYVVWWDNTTGNSEVSFAKSSDSGKTFGSTINISNSSDARSIGARMAAQG